MNETPTAVEMRSGEAATWGARPDASVERPRMRLIAWRPLIKGSLHGFATVELAIGLTIVDCPVLASKNGPWASRPSKPQIGQDGRPKTDINGKAQYAAILSWRDRELSNRFSSAVVELVRWQAYPDALIGDEP